MEKLTPKQVAVVADIYGVDLFLLSILACCTVYVLIRFRKQFKRVNGYFFPIFYVYAVIVITLRMASCILVLHTPKAFLQYLHPKSLPHASYISIMNTASKTATFCLGCLIVSTLYSTTQVLKYAHLFEIELHQVMRRKLIFNCIMGLLMTIMIVAAFFLYLWDSWTVQQDAFIDTTLFALLSIVYLSVVCYLFRILTRIKILAGSLDKEKDEIMN